MRKLFVFVIQVERNYFINKKNISLSLPLIFSAQTESHYRNAIVTFLLCMANAGNNTRSNTGKTTRSLSTLNLNNQITATTFFNNDFLSSTSHLVPNNGTRVSKSENILK